MARRERTRHLIELGGLVHKAGLVDLAGDDRATIYGALLELVGKARSGAADDVLTGGHKKAGGDGADPVALGACRNRLRLSLTV